MRQLKRPTMERPWFAMECTKTNPLAENVNKNDKIEKRTGVLGRKRSCHLPVKQFSRGLNYRKKGRISEIKKVADLGRKRSWLIV